MASIDGTPRLRIACDACDAEFRVGPAPDGWDAFCEACQRSGRVQAPGQGRSCEACGGPLTTGEPRFTELYGALQHLEAVLAAWAGDLEPLARILPERPRFLTDLTPDAPREDDPPAVHALLREVRAGHYDAARRMGGEAARAHAGDPRVWRALAIAAERSGDPTVAEEAWSRAAALAPSSRTHLALGALAARRGDFEAARAAFEQAGDGYEARWNRGALEVLEAVATTPGLPASERLARARALAGKPTGAWHEHTVGRLLWTLLVERAVSRASAGASPCPDERVLRAAEQELEFESFWDRALVLHGYARLGMRDEAARVARELAAEAVVALKGEPFVRGLAGARLADLLEEVGREVAAGRPDAARAAVRKALEAPGIARYRFPCARCGAGTIGVEGFEDPDGQS